VSPIEKDFGYSQKSVIKILKFLNAPTRFRLVGFLMVSDYSVGIFESQVGKNESQVGKFDGQVGKIAFQVGIGIF